MVEKWSECYTKIAMQNKNISSLTKLNFQIKTSQSLGILQPHPNFLIQIFNLQLLPKSHLYKWTWLVASFMLFVEISENLVW